MTNIGDGIKANKSYAIGDYCVNESSLWEFTAAKGTGAWDSSKVTQRSVIGLIQSLQSRVSTLETQVSALNANVLKMVKKEYITENKNHRINLPLYTVCLVVMANTYNAGSCWIVQTGGSVQQALINTIFETSYFSAKSSGQSQITITSTSAVGWCYVWLLGKT